jgi:predicted enzyme related to lactoylglutathione lyase
MAQPVVHFEVVGKDGAKLRQFYSGLFDWEIDASNPQNYGIVQPTAPGIGGGVGQSPDGSTHVTWYVQVDDLQAALDKAESLGGKTVMAPDEVPGGPALAMFADPEGNVIGLVAGM